MDDVLSNSFNKDLTVLHVDGKASEQKRQEHRRRNQYLRKSLDGLEAKVNNPGTKPSKQLFRACRNLYRLPRDNLHHDVISVLQQLGWSIHYCTHQADTCLAAVCQDSAPDSITIVTSDSDLMVYEGVQSLVMPFGRSRELLIVDKKKLLQHLDLPSQQHLLLACIVTTNDYVKNIPYFGLSTNCDIVRGIDLSALGPLGAMANNAERASSIMPFIQLYLNEVRSRLIQQKLNSKRQLTARAIKQDVAEVRVDHYTHSVTSFVARTETSMAEPLLLDDQSPCSHETITKVIQKLYSRKTLQQQSRLSRNVFNTLTLSPPSNQVLTTELSGMVADMNIEPVLSSTSAQFGAKKFSPSNRNRKSSQRRLQNQKDRFKDKLSENKQKKWRQSQ